MDYNSVSERRLLPELVLRLSGREPPQESERLSLLLGGELRGRTGLRSDGDEYKNDDNCRQQVWEYPQEHGSYQRQQCIAVYAVGCTITNCAFGGRKIGVFCHFYCGFLDKTNKEVHVEKKSFRKLKKQGISDH